MGKSRESTFLQPREFTDVIICHDWIFDLPKYQRFKGAGILVALYSLHSRNSICKIGEFMDLKLLIDWAVKANLLFIQLLPIQDINFIYSKHEGNPSRQVSAFAFNPMYLTLRCINGYNVNTQPPKRRDFITVTKFKMQQLKIIFNETVDIGNLRKDKKFVHFVKRNNFWLPPYCLWCKIKNDELEKNPNLIPNFPDISSVKMPDLLEGELDDSLKQCMFYCWVQFQCHLQLLEITNYAIENRVILSSLMTIGQNFISADNWSHPEWFDKRYTIGAPPDIFSFNGQNWYYPAWDWGAMRESNFLWLRQQIGHREQYFQATMFDHPLGLFRCWNIPANIDNPLFGHFVPSIPINIQDLNNHQITDIDNLCVPYFPVNDILSINLPMSIKEKLISNLSININGRYRFRPDFKSDREVSAAIKSFQEGLSFDEQLQLKLASKIILSSFESICLIPDITSPHDKFYPRFSMTDSIVFKSLPEREAQILYKLFIDFYYRTNVSLWHEQGHQTLAVLSSSQMQFIGYDLGVSLNDEEDSLHQAGICSFRVQRVPRDSSLRFDLTTTFPYLSVCTPSTHDMQHLKLLWSNDQADVQQFYYQVLKMEGIPPRELTPEIAHEIIKQHLQAQSMWCLFQFEDLFAISPKLSKLISSDWINNPAKKHDWSYRINIKLEKLLEENQNWTEEIANLVDEAQRGRKADYGF